MPRVAILILLAITTTPVFSSTAFHEIHFKDHEGHSKFSDFAMTTHGPVRGITKYVTIKGGREVKVDVFWGIPYAKPPTGELRFKRPVPADSWTGVLDAVKAPNSCMQILEENPVLLPNPPTPVSEDCLYLNIWRPRCHSSKIPEKLSFFPEDIDDHDNSIENERDEKQESISPLATMVWIHGGGYMTGSSTMSTYNGEILAASECVIVVSMNYRLGALGFMFLDVPEVPGNMGLLDMAMATKWVKDNIQNFGGDHKSITVFGNSAGAASTSLFLLSPLTEKLFYRAIIQSGSPISHLAISTREAALETAHEFSKAFNCYSEDNKKIAECLSEVDALTLTQEHSNLAKDYKHFMTAVEDDYFLTQDPREAFKSGDFKRCSVLLGTTRDEGTYFMGIKWPEVYDFTKEQIESISEQNLDQKLTEFLSDFLKPGCIPEVIDDIKRVYQLDLLRQDVEDPHLTLLNYVIGDVINTCPIRQMAQAFSQASQDAFLYSFNHPHERSPLASWVGAIHGSELAFMLGEASVDRTRFSPREARLSERMMALWADFAKFGNPTPTTTTGVIWPYYDGHDPGKYLQFSPSANILEDKTKAFRCSYWINLPQEYLRT